MSTHAPLMKPPAIASPLVTLVSSLALLGGCTTTSINSDAAQRTNDALERFDQAGAMPHSRYYDQELRLWQDQPLYTALLEAPPPTKRMRLISAVAPAYPPLMRLAHANARVMVSFVVGIDGHVEAARVLESSDSRFDDSALEAIRRFTFLPAVGSNGPAREIALMPIDYWWSHAARMSSASSNPGSVP